MMRRVILAVAGILLVACSKQRATIPIYEPAQAAPEYPKPTIIYRTSSYPNDELAARGIGTLAFVVRVSEQPLRVVANAQVLVRLSESHIQTTRMSDERGQVTFDSVAVGQREVWVRAIGYGQAKFAAPVSPGCRTDVEVYIGIQAIGIASGPPQPGRAVITTCRPGQ